MLSGASATLLLTLAARAAASRDKLGQGFHDPLAEAAMAALPGSWQQNKLDPGLVTGVVLRSQWFDQLTANFLQRHPLGAVITVGAGLCTRLSRLRQRLGWVDNPVVWWNVDLPDVIALRTAHLPLQPGEQSLAASALDTAWLGALQLQRFPAVLMIWEGICPYLPQPQLSQALQQSLRLLKAQTGYCEWALDFIDPAMASPTTQVGGMHLPLQSGFTGVEVLLQLHPGFQLVSAAYPFESFSEGHARAGQAFVAQHGRMPYTLAHFASAANKPQREASI